MILAHRLISTLQVLAQKRLENIQKREQQWKAKEEYARVKTDLRIRFIRRAREVLADERKKEEERKRELELDKERQERTRALQEKREAAWRSRRPQRSLPNARKTECGYFSVNLGACRR